MADLVTKQEYKIYAGINSTNHDAEIDFLIPKVSEFVKTYCRRTFVDHFDEAKIEVFDGGHKTFLLKETPVTQIISVERSTDYGKTYTKLNKFIEWVPQGDTVLCLEPGGTWQELVNGYRVTYFAGFETVPSDLKLAVLDLVSYYRKNDAAIHSTKSPGSNTTQIEYISTTNLPAHIKRILDQYVADYA